MTDETNQDEKYNDRDVEDEAEVEVEISFMESDEIPPLNVHAELLLGALRAAGQALGERQLHKQTGVPLNRMSSSIALLMMHGLVKPDHCARRGHVWRSKA